MLVWTCAHKRWRTKSGYFHFVKQTSHYTGKIVSVRKRILEVSSVKLILQGAEKLNGLPYLGAKDMLHFVNPKVFVVAKNRDGDQILQRLKLGERSTESAVLLYLMRAGPCIKSC